MGGPGHLHHRPCSKHRASHVLHPEDPGSPSSVSQWTLFLTNHPDCVQMSSLRSSCFGGGSCNHQLLVTTPLPAEPPGSAPPHPSLSGGAPLAKTCCSLPFGVQLIFEGDRSERNQPTNLCLGKTHSPQPSISSPCKTGHLKQHWAF